MPNLIDDHHALITFLLGCSALVFFFFFFVFKIAWLYHNISPPQSKYIVHQRAKEGELYNL